MFKNYYIIAHYIMYYFSSVKNLIRLENFYYFYFIISTCSTIIQIFKKLKNLGKIQLEQNNYKKMIHVVD
jgi:hypothetical protein